MLCSPSQRPALAFICLLATLYHPSSSSAEPHPSTVAAEKHFTSHGARLPTPAFLAALAAAALDVSRHQPDGYAHAIRRHRHAEGAPWASAGMSGSSTGANGSSSGGSGGSEGVSGMLQPQEQRRGQLLIMAMANELAVEVTVPIFLKSLSLSTYTEAPKKEAASSGSDAAAVSAAQKAALSAPVSGATGVRRTLDEHVVVACSSAAATVACRKLPFKHHCIHDTDYGGPTEAEFLDSAAASEDTDALRQADVSSSNTGGSRGGESGGGGVSGNLSKTEQRAVRARAKAAAAEQLAAAAATMTFHTAGFNALGFAKIKYILNTLGAGYDVLFMDTDIVVLQDVIAYILSLGADMAVTAEKCIVTDDSLQYQRLKNWFAPNIGVLYFRSTSGVLRCVYSWMTQMASEVVGRPKVWDQDLYGKVVFPCATQQDLSTHVFSTRAFNSGCFPRCGCHFPDEHLSSKLGNLSKIVPFVSGSTKCSAKHWVRWVLMHYPCVGDTLRKAKLMQSLLDAHMSNASEAHINPPKRLSMVRRRVARRLKVAAEASLDGIRANHAVVEPQRQSQDECLTSGTPHSLAADSVGKLMPQQPG